jgi:hypothetical protein
LLGRHRRIRESLDGPLAHHGQYPVPHGRRHEVRIGVRSKVSVAAAIRGSVVGQLVEVVTQVMQCVRAVPRQHANRVKFTGFVVMELAAAFVEWGDYALPCGRAVRLVF